MFNKKCGLVLLTLLLLFLSVSSVTAADNNTDSLTTVGDNSCLFDVNCSNTLNNDLNNHDVICNDSDIDCCGAIAFQSVLKQNVK